MSFRERRLEKVRDAMASWGADLLFLNFGPEMTYLTGIQTPIYYGGLKMPGDWLSGLLVSTHKDPILVLEEALVETVPQTRVQDIRILSHGQDPQIFLKKIISELAPEGKTIAVGKKAWSQSLLALQEVVSGARFIPATSSMMDKVREVKDEEEISLMSRAAEITDMVMAATVANLRSGMSERDVAIEVEYQTKLAGGDDYSFYPGITCVGRDSDPKRGILVRNTETIVQPGTTVAFDFGVLHKGYCSDFGRTVFVGEPNPEAVRAYDSIARVALSVMEEMGNRKITPEQVAEFVEDSLRAEGFGDYCRQWYGLVGHGIGLEVHEAPYLCRGYQEPIKKGMCFTVEPRIWKPYEFCVRTEDVVVVGEERGHRLTNFTYDPQIID